MKRLIAFTISALLFAAPAYAGEGWHRHRDRDSGGTSDILRSLVKLQLLGLVVQGLSARQESYIPQQSLKDPYYQPNIPGDPYPPIRRRSIK